MRSIQFISYLALCFWGVQAHAAEEDFYKFYDNAHISSCELRNLQSYWGLSDRYETKLAIGKKLAAKKNISSDIVKAADAARKKSIADCDFWSLDFTYEDAEVMAGFWKIDTYEAKLKMANKVAYGTQLDMKNWVKEVRSSASPVQKGVSPADTFFKSGYDYCHAKMIGYAYDVSTFEAKTWMGGLLNSGERALVESKLAFGQERTRSGNPQLCSFYETRFKYEDAEKLAKMWNTSVSEAKLALTQKYLHGLERDLEKELRK